MVFSFNTAVGASERGWLIQAAEDVRASDKSHQGQDRCRLSAHSEKEKDMKSGLFK